MMVCVHMLDDPLLRCFLLVWGRHLSGSHGTLGLHYGNPMVVAGRRLRNQATRRCEVR
jgi:hypothetical protein